MLYLRMSACWLEHTRLQMIERVRELRCQSFRSSPRRPPKSEERKGRKKMRAEMGSISHPRLPRDDDTKRKSNRKHSASRTSASRSTPTPSRPSRLPLRFPSRGSPSQPLKKTKWDASFYAKKKSESNAETTAYHARPPLALSFG